MATLVDDLKVRAEEVPERIAIWFEEEDTITFSELWKQAVKVAEALQKSGVKRNDKVFVYIQNSIELVESIYGVWIAGATCVPINVMWKKDEIMEDIKTTESKWGITNQRNLPEIKRVAEAWDFKGIYVFGSKETLNPPFHNFEPLLATCQGEYANLPPIHEEDIGVIIHTGGTSGDMKAAVITHGSYNQTVTNLVESNTGKKAPLPPVDETEPPNIIALPLYHGGGLQSFNFAIKAGRSVVLMEKFETVKFARLVEKHKIKTIVCMPTMIQMLANEKEPITLSSLKFVLCTGGALTAAVQKQFTERFGVPIGQNYGSTEAGHLAGTSYRDIKMGNFKPGAVGRPYKGVTLKIVDENGNELPPGQTGEIVAFSKGAMQGYLKKEGSGSVSDEIVKNGWVYTGDLGYLDEDGYLFIVGRKRDIIKCGGFQVYPVEIENCLLKHPAVKEVAVIGAKDDRLGEIPKAFIVKKEGYNLTAEDVIAYCRENLAKYKAVRQVVFVDSLPKNEAGKVLKRLLS